MAISVPFPLPNKGFALNRQVKINLDAIVTELNKFNSGTATWDAVYVGTQMSNTGAITLYNSTNSYYTKIQSGVATANQTYTLPTAVPAATGFLQADSSGVMSWAFPAHNSTTSIQGGTTAEYYHLTSAEYTGTGTGNFVRTASPTLTTPTINTSMTVVNSVSQTYTFPTNYPQTTTAYALLLSDGSGTLKWDTNEWAIQSDTAGVMITSNTGNGAINQIQNTFATRGYVVMTNSSVPPQFIELKGTASQITVTHNADDDTLSVPNDFAVGSAGVAGSVSVYPTTSSKGTLKLSCSDSAGNTVTEITNASQAAARTYTIPDAGESASFVMNKGARNISGATVFESQVTLDQGIDLVMEGATSGTVTLAVPDVISTYVLTLPANDGDANQVLTTNGSGVCSWEDAGSGTGSGTVNVGTADKFTYYATSADEVSEFSALTYYHAASSPRSIDYRESLAGYSVGLQAYNVDNTDGDSDAMTEMRVGGTSGGDAYSKYTVNGVGPSWFAGVDNSDSDSYKISRDTADLGTGNCLTITTAGQVTQPLQPCFLAKPTANATDVTGDGTDATVDVGTEIFDIGSDFGSNTFTAPVTGKYQLNAMVSLFQLDSDLHTSMSVLLISSNRTYAVYSGNIAKNTTHYETITIAVLADMDANDTVYFRVSVSGSSKVVDIDNSGTFFSGSLIN